MSSIFKARTKEDKVMELRFKCIMYWPCVVLAEFENVVHFWAIRIGYTTLIMTVQKWSNWPNGVQFNC